jgi:DNA-binding LacI/PurR family transcriptional regulator
MKPTAKQVAHIAGVSISAVSRAFTPGAPIDEGKRKRIFAASEEIGYISPARRTANVIAADTVTLVAGDLLNPFYPLVLDTLAKQLQAAGRQLQVYALHADTNVDTLIPKILAARPSAVIVTSASLSSTMAQACRQHRIPVVLLNRMQRDMRVNAVTCDNFAGGRDVASLLLARGRQRMGFIGGMSNTSTHFERARGFSMRLAEAGQRIHCELSGQFNYRNAYSAAVELLSRSNPPDALFCCNDIMALAAIDAARERGLVVPDDVSIVGFDDIPMAAWTSYRLTTIRQPVERMIQQALDLIFNDGALSGESSHRSLPGKLIIRASA